MEKILTVVDFSEATSEITKNAVKLAKAFSAKVYLVHALSPNEGLESGATNDVTQDFPDETTELNELANTLRQQDIETHAILAAGIPSQVIMDEANNIKADLIIAGSHGHGGLTNMILGDVIQDILRHANVPILIIPEHD